MIAHGVRVFVRAVAVAIASIALAAGSAANAVASQSSAGTITQFSAGWNTNEVNIQLDIPFHNPDNCPWTDGYLTDESLSGTNLFNSVLLTAFMSQRQVQLVVEGCYLQRPRIVGVRIVA